MSGCLGLCSPTTAKSDIVSEVNMMGTGGTSEWKMCSAFPNSTLCFFFETTGQESNAAAGLSQLFLQFITTYQHSSGQKRIRVTTVNRRLVEIYALLIEKFISYNDFLAVGWIYRILPLRLDLIRKLLLL